MKDLRQLKITLKNDLPENGISSIIKTLKGLLPEESTKYNSLINLESDYREVKIKQLDGVLSDDEIRRFNADIRRRLLELIDSLQEADFDISAPSSDFSETYKKGHVLYQVPKKMQVFKETKCRVRIAFDKMMLVEDLDLEEDTKVKSEIRISDYMKVEIMDQTNNETFEIRTTSSPVQFIDKDDFTEWFFFVKPLRPGEHILDLKVTIMEIINGKEIPREKVLSESVVIVSEAVEEEEAPFVKATEELVMGKTHQIIGKGDKSGTLATLETTSTLVTRTSPSPKNSGARLPKSIKTMALGLLVLMVTSTASYAFVPAVQQEVDWFVADKIVADEEAYTNFVKKHLPKEKSSPKLAKRIIKAVEKVETLEWENVASIENPKEQAKAIVAYQHRFPVGVKSEDAKVLLEKLVTIQPELKMEVKAYKAYKTSLPATPSRDILAEKSLELGKEKISETVPEEENKKFEEINNAEELAAEKEQAKKDSIALVQKEAVKKKADAEAAKKEEAKRTTEERKKNETNTSKDSNFKKSTFTDPRDGKTYNTIFIDGKWWMAQNLNYKSSESYCYADQESNCQKYGRLYTWKAALSACPDGWHLPSDEEWSAMLNTFGKNDDCEKCYDVLIEGGSSGFAALLGGYRRSGGEFVYLGSDGYYWSPTERDADYAWYYRFNKDYGVSHYDLGDKASAFLCRCIKD